MKAAILKAKDTFTVEEVPNPKPRPGEVVIKVRYCGICGSDLHAASAGNLPSGSVLGHEFTGELWELGEGVQGWKIGDRVTSLSGMPCGVCDPCRARRYFECQGATIIGLGPVPGGYAQFVRAHSSLLVRVPDNVTYREAAINEPLAVALFAARKADLKLGQRVVITGAGPIGLLVLQCVKLAGPVVTYVIEPSPVRAKAALALGANRVLNPFTEDTAKEIFTLTNGGPDVVFECAGVRGALQRAVEIVRHKGRVRLVGVCTEPDEVVPLTWIGKEVLVEGSLGGRIEFPLGMKLLAMNRINAEPVISHVVPLEAVHDTFMALAKPKGHIKVLVDPWGSSF